MNKSFRYLILIQLFLVCAGAFGQNTLSFESIHLQIDREVYIAGEEMFFNCFCYQPIINKSVKDSKVAYLVLRNENNIIISGSCFKLENNMFSGSINLPDTLSTGRYQLVSYTNAMRNFGENTFFKKEILVANRFDKDLFRLYSNRDNEDSSFTKERERIPLYNGLVKIEPEKLKYNRREKIKVKLTAPGMKIGQLAQLVVSVHEKAYQQDQPQTEKTVVLNRKKICRYFPETNHIILEGQVINTTGNKAMSDVLVYLSTPDTVSNLQITHTDKDGIFRFQLNDYYNLRNLIISLPENPKGQIILDNKFELKEPFVSSRAFPDTLIRDYITKSQIIVQIQKEYKTQVKKELTNTFSGNKAAPLIYPPITDQVYPSDFVDLPDFIEISRELLHFAKTRKNGFGYETRIINTSQNTYFDGAPLILLDGVPINTINQVIGFGTEKIRRIETVPTQRYFGGESFDGILAIFSKNMEINNIAWQTPAINVNYVQLQPKAEFVRTQYSKSNKIPVFTQLLYWNSNLTLHANESETVEFFASDNKGEFEITAEGIASDGTLIKASAIVNIGVN
jgi:hypothetical protein